MAAAYLAAAVWVTWPLALGFRTGMPTGKSLVGTVPMLNAWSIWWNAESLSRGLLDYWNAPIFSPTTGTFAFSDPQPITWLLAPLQWISGSPVATYNTYLLLTLVLNGLLAARLLRLLKSGETMAICGGLAVVTHPLALQNLEVIQLLSLWPILWTMDASLRFWRQPSWQSGSVVGLALAACVACSVHQALLWALVLVLCVPLWSLPLLPRFRRPIFRSLPEKKPKIAGRRVLIAQVTGQHLLGLVCGAAVACLLCGPLLWPMAAILRSYGFHRDLGTVQALSAHWSSWLSTPNNAILPLHFSSLNSKWALLPGVATTATALIGCWWRGRRIWQDDAMRLLTLIVLCSLILSFGGHLRIGNWNAWTSLSELFSPLNKVRSPYRFAYITQLGITLLAFTNVGLLRYTLMQRFTGKKRHWSLAILGAFGALLAIETPPPQTQLCFPPRSSYREAWVQFVADRLPVDSPLICLPVARNASETAQEQSTIWMMYACQHGRPLLNGYSGFFPPSWVELEPRLRQQPLEAATLDRLREMGARAMVVRKDRMFSKEANRFELPEPGQRAPALIFEDERYEVWQLD